MVVSVFMISIFSLFRLHQSPNTVFYTECLHINYDDLFRHDHVHCNGLSSVGRPVTLSVDKDQFSPLKMFDRQIVYR